jgi:hypothetical protein
MPFQSSRTPECGSAAVTSGDVVGTFTDVGSSWSDRVPPYGRFVGVGHDIKSASVIRDYRRPLSVTSRACHADEPRAKRRTRARLMTRTQPRRRRHRHRMRSRRPPHRRRSSLGPSAQSANRHPGGNTTTNRAGDRLRPDVGGGVVDGAIVEWITGAGSDSQRAFSRWVAGCRSLTNGVRRGVRRGRRRLIRMARAAAPALACAADRAICGTVLAVTGRAHRRRSQCALSLFCHCGSRR